MFVLLYRLADDYTAMLLNSKLIAVKMKRLYSAYNEWGRNVSEQKDNGEEGNS